MPCHDPDCRCVAHRHPTVLDTMLAFELSSSAYPGISCVTPGNPYVLHCFPPFASDLTAEHHRHLDIIAKQIQRSFTTSRPITKVEILGHASTWRGTSPTQLTERSIRRAGTAGNQLILRLHDMGLASRVDVETDGRSDAVKWLGKPYSSTSGSRAAQEQRALNRRVEIRLLARAKKKKKQQPVTPTCEIGELIRSAPVASLTTSAATRKRLECLRSMIASAICGAKIDDRYWVYESVSVSGRRWPCTRVGQAGSFGIVKHTKPRHALERFKRWMGSSEDPKVVAQAIKKVHDDIFCQINLLSYYLSNEAGNVPKSSFIEMTECIEARMLKAQSKKRRPPSILACFAALLDQLIGDICNLPTR